MSTITTDTAMDICTATTCERAAPAQAKETTTKEQPLKVLRDEAAFAPNSFGNAAWELKRAAFDMVSAVFGCSAYACDDDGDDDVVEEEEEEETEEARELRGRYDAACDESMVPLADAVILAGSDGVDSVHVGGVGEKNECDENNVPADLVRLQLSAISASGNVAAAETTKRSKLAAFLATFREETTTESHEKHDDAPLAETKLAAFRRVLPAEVARLPFAEKKEEPAPVHPPVQNKLAAFLAAFPKEETVPPTPEPAANAQSRVTEFILSFPAGFDVHNA